MTALMVACHKGRKDVVKLLLDHSDIDLNAEDNTGRTALMIASQRGYQDMVQILARTKLQKHAKATRTRRKHKQPEAIHD